jgi:hypothetical protein
MTGITITQAALHAALRRVRDDGTYGSLDTLLTFLDPAHAAGGGAAWATTPEAKRPAEPCYDEAGTPAPPIPESSPSPWHDIATAPSQTSVLVCSAGMLGWWAVAWRTGLGEWCNDGGLNPLPYTPTHFALLPAPPTFHAPSLAAEEAQPAHRDHLPTPPGAAEIAGDPGVEAGRAPSSARNTPPPAQAAEGHPTPPKAPWGRRPISVWTPERVAMLRERLPTCLDDAALFADLNALPAQLPVSTVGSMRKQAVKLGVQREGAVIKQLMQAGARKGLSRANEERLRLINDPPPDAPPPKARTYAMTAERLDALPALWTDPNLTAGDIMAKLNFLPGLRITNSTVLYGWAQKIGLSTHRPQPQDEAPPPTPPTVLHALGLPAEPTPEEQAAIADAAVLSKHDRAKAKLRQALGLKHYAPPAPARNLGGTP